MAMSRSTGGNTSGGHNTYLILTIVALLAVILGALAILSQDNRPVSERLGDAVEAAPQGLDKAADELGDRPPAENIERNTERALDEVQ